MSRIKEYILADLRKLRAREARLGRYFGLWLLLSILISSALSLRQPFSWDRAQRCCAPGDTALRPAVNTAPGESLCPSPSASRHEKLRQLFSIPWQLAGVKLVLLTGLATYPQRCNPCGPKGGTHLPGLPFQGCKGSAKAEDLSQRSLLHFPKWSFSPCKVQLQKRDVPCFQEGHSLCPGGGLVLHLVLL